MSDKRKRAARALMAETGWNYTKALREADRRHAESQDGSSERTPAPEAVFVAPDLDGEIGPET